MCAFERSCGTSIFIISVKVQLCKNQEKSAFEAFTSVKTQKCQCVLVAVMK